jgi:2-polyprenyl-3-methyl-5-hydroxy-6-metoxy-1,4-benzoquinol methylase
MDKTREPQYQKCLDIRDQQGLTQLGLMSNQAWNDDPRHLLFQLARYKFVAKMFHGMKNVLEVGCADAFGTRVVLQEVETVTAVDFDPVFVDDALKYRTDRWNIEIRVHDILEGPVNGEFDAAFSLDVIEHIQQEKEELFVSNIANSIKEQGVVIIGTPSLESQAYASPPSRKGHINCKNAATFKDLMLSYFDNAFLFSMNDEVVHTGFYPMAHYLFAVCCGRK